MVLLVAECAAGQQVQPSHLRVDQPLNMPAEARYAWRAPVNGITGVLASTLEGTASEVGAIADVNSFGQTGDGPGLFDLAFLQLS